MLAADGCWATPSMGEELDRGGRAQIGRLADPVVKRVGWLIIDQDHQAFDVVLSKHLRQGHDAIARAAASVMADLDTYSPPQ